MNRHLILTNGRSGSNYFVQMLNSHPHVVNYGEVLGEWTFGGKWVLPRFRGPRGPERYLDFLYGSRAAFAGAQAYSFAFRKRSARPTHHRRRRDVRSLGVKEFSVNFARFGLGPVLEDRPDLPVQRAGLGRYLEDRPDTRLVTLVRENPLERLVSVRRLSETGQVARIAGSGGAGPGSPPADRTELAIDSLVRDLDVIEGENAAVRAAADHHAGPVFRIEYEAYFDAEPDARERVDASLLEFLGVAPTGLIREHRRLRQTDLSESVANFDAVVATLRSSPYARWVEPYL